MSRRSIEAGKAVIVVDVVDKATASFKKLQSGIMNASRGFRDIGTNAAGAALLTGVPIAKGLGNYAKFTDSLQNIEAKLGNFGLASAKVRQDSTELRNEIIKLGRDTSYTSREVADAAAAMAQGGFAGDEIKSSLKAVVDLGRGTNLALDEAARLSVTLATTFKLFKEGANDVNSAAMTQVADQLTKAARLSVAEIQDIGASLVYVSQKAADLGVTVPEVLTLLNQLAQAGIKGSVAGTSLNTAFGNLTNNLDKIKKTFPNFDIIFKPNGAVDAIETFGRLGQLMKNMGKVAKTQFLQDIFNLRGERAASALEDLKSMRKGLRQITDSAGEAAMSAQTMQAGFGGALERISGAIDAVVNKIGIKFNTVLKGTSELIAIMIDKIGDLSVKQTTLLGVIILSPAIFAATAAAALTMSFVLARLSVIVGLLVRGFKSLKSVGSIMLGGAKSLVSPIAAISNSRAIKAAAIKKTSERIAKLQTALDISYAKANARKVGAASAVAKIAASKKQAQLISAVSARSKLQAGVGSVLSRGKEALSDIGSSIANRYRAVAAAIAEKKEIKTIVGLERALSAQQVRQNRLRLAAIKDSPVNESERLAKIIELNKGAIAAKQKALHLTQLERDAQHGLNELTFLHSRTNPARERAIQQAYDELYKTRQQQKGVSATQHPTTHAMLAEKEAKLAKFINVEQAKQANITSRIALGEERVLSLRAQAAKHSKLSTTLSERAIRNSKTLKAVENINFTNQLRRDAVVAKSTAQGVASTARIARAGKAMKSASIGKALFSGIGGLFNIGKLGKAISTIAQLTFTFGRLAVGLARFVFSWNAVGLAFNALLLFGDKIPFINKAFKDLGAGISGAFYQISQIGTLAAPALKLFSLAIEAFASGNSAIGIEALKAAFTGVVSIITNQLTAAWAVFSMRVADLWNNITKIGTAIFSVFSTLFKGLGEIFGNMFQGISERVSGLFGGKGESTFFSTIFTIAMSLNNFISEFSKSIIMLQDWSGEFLTKMTDIASGKSTLESWGKFSTKLTLGAGKSYDETDKQNPRITEIDNSRKKAEDELIKIFTKLTEPDKNQNLKDLYSAQQKSTNASFNMEVQFDELLKRLNAVFATQTAAAQEAANKKPFVENIDQNAPDVPAIQRFVTRLDALVGSLGDTRNIYKIEKPTTVNEIKKTNEKLDILNNTIKTVGAVGH